MFFGEDYGFAVACLIHEVHEGALRDFARLCTKGTERFSSAWAEAHPTLPKSVFLASTTHPNVVLSEAEGSLEPSDVSSWRDPSTSLRMTLGQENVALVMALGRGPLRRGRCAGCLDGLGLGDEVASEIVALAPDFSFEFLEAAGAVGVGVAFFWVCLPLDPGAFDA